MGAAPIKVTRAVAVVVVNFMLKNVVLLCSLCSSLDQRENGVFEINTPSAIIICFRFLKEVSNAKSTYEGISTYFFVCSHDALLRW